MLCAADSLGDSLALCCPRHPQTTIEVQQPDDFLKFSPEGGCREACTDRLDCGHRCQARCHSTAMHEVFVCEQPCQRRHQPCEHICQKPTCGQSCGKCMIKLDNVQLPCGHTKNDVACHLTLDLSKIYCKASVLKKVPNCGHNVAVMCSQDVTKEDFKCPTPCSTSLSCSHSCPGSCSRCKTKGEDGLLIVKHISCSKTCGRKSGTCNHNCPRKCHDGTDCGLCQQPCEVLRPSKTSMQILTGNRYAASTISARRNVMTHAPLALNHASGHASTKANARCLVLVLAIAYLATSAVASFFHAIISVPVSVAKCVQLIVAKNAA